MPPTTTTERLADYETRYRELAAQLASIGLIHSGSITRRYTRCATPGCKCHADPPQPHGPYYQWTAKINGKTVTRGNDDLNWPHCDVLNWPHLRPIVA